VGISGRLRIVSTGEMFVRCSNSELLLSVFMEGNSTLGLEVKPVQELFKLHKIRDSEK
jgi:hypothetical protein